MPPKKKIASTIPVFSSLWHKLTLMMKSRKNKKKDNAEGEKEQNDGNKSSKQDPKKQLSLPPNFNIGIDVKVVQPINLLPYLVRRNYLPVILAITLAGLCGYTCRRYSYSNSILGGMIYYGAMLMIPVIAVGIAALKAINIKYDPIGNEKTMISEAEFHEVANMLPWAYTEPEIETAKWISDILEGIWFWANAFIIAIVAEHCPYLRLDKFVGAFNAVANFRITCISLGDNVPKVTGIRVLKRGVRREDIIVECELEYDGDVNLQIQVDYFIKAGIKRLVFHGRIKIIITPLFRDIPVVGNISICFLNTPQIDWELTGFLRLLNWNFLKYFVSRVIAYFFLSPSRMSFRIANTIPVRELKLMEPIGLVRVDVIEAKNLPKADSKVGCCTIRADAYCMVKVEEKEMTTQVVSSNLFPKWKRQFNFMLHNTIENKVTATVWDEDNKEDQFIGMFAIPVRFFVKNKEANGQEYEVELRDIKGRILNKKVKPTLAFRVTWFKIEADEEKLKKSYSSDLPVAVLSVLVDSATGLETVTSQFRGPEMRPLVRLSVGNQIQATTIKRRTGNPVWEESHHFILFSPKLEELHVEIVDMYPVEEKQLLKFLPINSGKLNDYSDLVSFSQNGTVLGHTTIRLSDVMEINKMKIEGSFRLEGFVEEGYIRLLLAIGVTEPHEQISVNLKKPRMPFPEHLLIEQTKQKRLKIKEKSPSDKLYVSKAVIQL